MHLDAMKNPIRVLIIEDFPPDAELMVHELCKTGFDPIWKRIETESEYLENLDSDLDVILADYTLPQLHVRRALELLKHTGFDIPFIVVTGSIGEEVAVECMKQGATDYLLKDRLMRLGQAVSHALEQKQLRMAKKNTEQALKESEDRWQFALEGCGDGVWDWNIQTNDIFYSKQWKQIIGFGENEIEDDLSTRDKRIHPDDKDLVINEIQKHLNGDTPQYVAEYRVLSKYGTYKWILDRGKVIIRAEDGKPLRMVGTYTDITERKLLEEGLQERETNLRILFNSLKDFIFVLDMQGHILRINNTVVKRLGYSRKELLGKHVLIIHSPDKRDEASIVLDLGERRGAFYPLTLMTKEGDLIPVETKISRGRWSSKDVMFCISRDVTERLRVEEALRNSEQKFSKAFHASPNLMFIITVYDWRFIDVNECFLRTMGYKRGEVVDSTLNQLNIFVDHETRGRMENLFMAKGRVQNIEARFKLRSGEVRMGSFSAESIDVKGEKCLLVVVDDITERKKTEEKLLYLSTHDVLTGLYNRAYFEMEMSRMESGRQFPVSIVMMDIDGLKIINDIHGHAEGDQLMKCAAKVLKATFRSEDTVARIGGDEFAVLMPNTDSTTLESVLNRIRDRLSSNNINGDDISNLSLSIGASTGYKGCSLNDVIKQADKRMYEEKIDKSKNKNKL